jgi:2'-deoxynucleoside 5'-phosphate N-hydrolase
MTIKVYVSGPLTAVDHIAELKLFYEKIAAVYASENIDAYVPHILTDPLKNPLMTPQEVYDLDRQHVCESDLVLAYVGLPSIGVGQELEIARENNIPIVLLMEKDAQVSRMARGNPALIAEIQFDDFHDGLSKLSRWLKEWQR